MDICSCSLYSLGAEPAANASHRGAGTERQGGRKTQGNDPGASEKAEYLLPLGELMTLLANITIRLGTCQKSSRSPDCCCVLAFFFFPHVFIFWLWKLSFNFCPFVLMSLRLSSALALPAPDALREPGGSRRCLGLLADGLGRWGGIHTLGWGMQNPGPPTI